MCEECGHSVLHGQTALITGAGSGIGRAIALNLSEAGVRIALVGRDREKLEATRAILAGGEGSAMVVSCDVTNREEVGSAVGNVLAAFSSIDILVCGAGVNIPDRSLRSLDPADWDRLIATNLTGAFNMVHFVLPAMRERGRGLVIQISSLSGMRASTVGGAAYSASKFGQSALGICIGREERGRGIRSTVIYPGDVNTPLLDSRPGRPGAPAGRREGLLQPEDVAAAVRFVAELPPRAHVPEVVIKPAIDDFS
jgi:NADP-dependent 3-hydroxy acid dehydrogenase YdfG